MIRCLPLPNAFRLSGSLNSLGAVSCNDNLLTAHGTPAMNECAGLLRAFRNILLE